MKYARFLLLPLALIYGFISAIRNKLFDIGWLQSTSFDLPVICVGNLSVGGTGKTPVVEYLIQLLRKTHRPAVLSRGYRRRSSGYRLAGPGTDFREIGDEPRQLYAKFKDIPIAVGEQRIFAIPNILADRPETNVIIMDDGYQHRAIVPFLNILLTNYRQPFWEDFLLPAGLLREARKESRRANIIVVTKCPENLPESEQQAIIRRIKPDPRQQIFFSSLKYWDPYNIFHPEERIELHTGLETVLFTGIADSGPLMDHLKQKTREVYWLEFEDHHIYNARDLEQIKALYDQVDGQKVLLTTEKDAVRLEPFFKWFKENGIPLFCLPIQIKFLGSQGPEFDKLVTDSINYFYE